MRKSLVVLAGPDEGRVFRLGTDPLLLGRSRATESQLIDPHISRIHCQVTLEDDRYVLSDFDSAGGTFVNGRKITKHVLQAGDLIRIGGTRLQYSEEADFSAQVTNPAETTATAAPAAATVDTGSTPTMKGNWARQLSGQTFTHYKVGSLLAEGKTGYVFHARDTRKNLEVALKILDTRYGATDEAVARFVEAVKLVLPLRHPNIVKVYGAGKTGSNCWIAEEYVPGESLAAVIGRIENSGPIDWRHVLRVLVFLARALVYAHGKNIVHQSLTPYNVLLGKKMPNTKLSDLVQASAIETDPTVPRTSAGEPSEDLPYMSPERTDGPTRPVDARTDLYSLGATAFALLAGRPPFQGNTVQELVTQIRLQAPPRVRSFYPELPESLDFLILRLLAKRVEDRPQTARLLLRDLEQIAKDNGIQLE